MKNSDFKKQLTHSLHPSFAAPDEQHLSGTLLLIRQEASRKQTRKRISFPRFFAMQIKFIGRRIWCIQGIFLLFAACMLSRLYDLAKNPLYLTKLLFCLSVLICMTALPFIYRSVRWNMQEIESATRFSSVKLLVAKLIAVSIGDVLILGGIFVFTIIGTSLRAGSVIFYLCFPFLLAGSGCLFMLGHFPPKHFLIGSVGLCFFLILAVSALPHRYEFLLRQSVSAGGTFLCVLLAAFCAQQLHYIIRHSPYTEMQTA